MAKDGDFIRDFGCCQWHHVPFVGPLIAAGIGWQATFIFGEQLVSDAEQLAADILREIIDISDDDL